MPDSTGPIEVVALGALREGSGGGKADGLARLVELGFSVPPAFVVLGATAGAQLPDDVIAAFQGLGGAVAVRSSAEGEDGSIASFAGQFETVLCVADEPALRDAIERCLRSLHGARAERYGEELAGERPRRMSVVVQRMVDARAAGVAFTVDPVSQRPEVVVDAVRGLGEDLVAGRAAPDHYVVGRGAERPVLRREPAAGGDGILSDAELARIADDALRAERCFGAPLDLEWAIDRAGRLCWLQARPITTLAQGWDLCEFDVAHGADHVTTRFNIGEMIPGAVCPLDLSTTVPAIDHGVQTVQVGCGVLPRYAGKLHSVVVRYGHLFFDMTVMLEFGASVAGSNREALMHAICGRPIPELPDRPPARAWTRALNGARYARFVLSGPRAVTAFERKLEAFALGRRRDAAGMFREIDDKLPLLVEAYDVHIHCSARSGFAGALLEGILAQGKPPTVEHEAMLADLLDGAGAESVGVLRDLRRVVDAIAQDARSAAVLRAASPEVALAWLRGSEAGGAGRAFSEFLERHGHRAVRELALHQPGWIDDPLPLVVSLRAQLLAGPGSRRRARSKVRASWMTRAVVAFAHGAIRQREHSKSMLVGVVHHFKRAYRHLAHLLRSESLLDDPELIFFLTHQELGRLAVHGDRALATRAVRRREAYRVQQTLQFPDVCVGAPEPLAPETHPPLPEGGLQGKPVSRGVVEGLARVVRGFAEADTIRAGEILVAPLIDVGWSPYYGILGGLATELGSPMSHGAVVAREHGLPTVTNLRDATRVFRTGERVVLDGDRGVLRRADDATTATDPRPPSPVAPERGELSCP